MLKQRPVSRMGRGGAFGLVVALLLGGLAGCSSPEPPEKKIQIPPGGVHVRGAGATFPSPLYKRWFEMVAKIHPQTVITYEAVGSGEGIRRFMGKSVKEDERVDFGASDAAMKDEDIERVGPGVVMLPVTAGSVVLAYNLPDLAGELKLSRRAYAGIFLGEIKYWNDPVIARANPGLKLPKLTIATVVRQDGSGTTFAFTKNLDAINEKWRARYGPATLVNWPGNAMRAKGNEGVATRIRHSVGAIGYVGYEFAVRLGLKTALLENREGNFIRSTPESCTAALATAEMPENLRVFLPDPSGPVSYPIVTFTWILLYRNYPDFEKARAVRDLFRWCLDEGQRFAPELGYVQLPANVREKALTALQTIGHPAAGPAQDLPAER